MKKLKKHKHHHCGCSKIIVVPYIAHRRKRRRIRRASTARIDQSASVNGPVSGLINIIIQVPINAGDATSLNDSDQNTVTNVV